MLILGASLELLAGTACLGSRQVPSSVVNSDRKTWLRGAAAPLRITAGSRRGALSSAGHQPSTNFRPGGHKKHGKIDGKTVTSSTPRSSWRLPKIYTPVSLHCDWSEDWAKVAALVIQQKNSLAASVAMRTNATCSYSRFLWIRSHRTSR